MANLFKAVHDEITRVRELIPLYEAIGPAGLPARLMMQTSIALAEIALESADVSRLTMALIDLRGYEA